MNFRNLDIQISHQIWEIVAIISYLFIYLFIYLFLSALGLCCCARAFSSCSDRGLLFVVVNRLLIVVSSLVAEHRFQVHGLQQLCHTGSVVVTHRLSSCGAQAQLLCGMWDPPGPVLKTMSLHWQVDSQSLRHQGSPLAIISLNKLPVPSSSLPLELHNLQMFLMVSLRSHRLFSFFYLSSSLAG